MYVKRHEQFEIGCGAILNKNIIIITIWCCCVQVVMEHSLRWDTDNDGIIDNAGFADQTYDAWTVTGAR